MAASTHEISERLSQYLNEEIPLRDFEDWFVPATWDNHLSEDLRAESLADDIELFLSEYRDGVLTKHEFRKELAKSIRPFARIQVSIVRASASRVIPYTFELIRKQQVSDRSGAILQEQWLESA